MEVTEYITKEGDRWDNIAYRAFGTCTNDVEIDGVMMNPIDAIIQLNPDVPITDVLAAGIKLYVPIVEQNSVETSLLPPWKR